MDDYLSRQLAAVSSEAASASGSSLDWLDKALGTITDTAVKGVDAYAKIQSVKNGSTPNYQAAQNAQQQATSAYGATNFIKGVDNNVLLMGGAAVLAIVFLMKG